MVRASRSFGGSASAKRLFNGSTPRLRCDDRLYRRLNLCRVAHHSTQKEKFLVARAIKARVDELQADGLNPYPRLDTQFYEVSPRLLGKYCETLQPGQMRRDIDMVFEGRIESIRIAGSSLCFVRVIRDDNNVQIVVSLSALETEMTVDSFKARRRLLNRGNIISVTGHPYRSLSGEVSLKVTEFPCILSPCLHDPAVQKSPGIDDINSESSPQNLSISPLRPCEMSIIRRRSLLIRQLRLRLEKKGYLEVHTPIISNSAGGAVAKSFQTSATEFPERRLSLRVAPELWLKRLVLGGFSKVFEIGPCFRNEGISKLHNPEFTTCEFYCAYGSLKMLLDTTEKFLFKIVKHIQTNDQEAERYIGANALKLSPLALQPDFFKGPYPYIDFLTGLNEVLGQSLPDLEADTATATIIKIFEEKNFTLPDNPSLPRLLDKLCAICLEPQCVRPTWIINQPECLSPLSKSFTSETSGIPQRVAARGELFIHGYEVVNCYEEENSPFEQRKKFQMQRMYANPTGADSNSDTPGRETLDVDEGYLAALEWGLPPTAGWGCGIDRLVMLLTGKERIQDVLPFGTLRSVTRPPDDREMIEVDDVPFAKVSRGQYSDQ